MKLAPCRSAKVFDIPDTIFYIRHGGPGLTTSCLSGICTELLKIIVDVVKEIRSTRIAFFSASPSAAAKFMGTMSSCMLLVLTRSVIESKD